MRYAYVLVEEWHGYPSLPDKNVAVYLKKKDATAAAGAMNLKQKGGTLFAVRSLPLKGYHA